MTILVTTPNGKVGSEIVRQLQQQGASVRVGAHTVSKAEAAFPGAEVVHFDYHDAASVEAALKGVTALYVATSPDITPDIVNRTVDQAKAAGVKRVVHLGAMGADAPEAALRQRELYLEASGLEWTFLRPTWFLQNYLPGQLMAVRNGVIAEPSADGKTGFIDARDIAAVAVTALTQEGHNGKIYTLTGGEAVDRDQVASAISKATGLEVKYTPLTDDQFREAAKGSLPPEYLEMLLGIFGAIRAGYTEATTPDVQNVLGRAPITLQQFANDYREAWQPVSAQNS